METKVCKKCGQEKEVKLFPIHHKHKTKNKIYYKPLCKECESIYQKNYRQEHKEEVKAYNQEYYQENKEDLIDYQAERYKNNKEEILRVGKEYRKKNKKKIQAKKNKKYNERRKKDPVFRFRKLISAAVRRELKKNGSSKNKHSITKFLDITAIHDHIESLFYHPDSLTLDGKVWMNWSNQGTYTPDIWDDNDPSTWTWQLDHIKAHSKFQYSSMEDQSFKDCWALSNLRPYPAKKNIKDGNRR